MITVAVLVVFVAYNEADQLEQLSRPEAYSRLGTTFEVPYRNAVNKQDVFWAALRHTAEQSQINVFRKVDGWALDGEPFAAYYVLLTSENTALFDAFSLRSGRFLEPSDLQDCAGFLSTTLGSDPGQIGLLDDIGRNNRVSIYGMQRLFETYPASGLYVIETHDRQAAEAFVTLLEGTLAAGGVYIDIGLYEDYQHYSFYSYSSGFASTLLWLAILAVAIMAVYRQLYEAKRTAVLRLSGNSPLQVWFLISGRFILVSMASLVVAGVVATLALPGPTTSLAPIVALRLAGIAALLIAVSLASLVYIRSAAVHEALKNRKDTLSLVIVSLIIKGVLSLVLIYMGATSISQYSMIQTEKQRFGNWQHTAQYGVYYPMSVGLDGMDSLGHVHAQIAYELYPALNRDGALFVEATDYAYNLENSTFGFKSIKVNPNYLGVYPVLDVSGKPITIQEDETDWILLVPESYRPQETEIINAFRLMRLGSGEGAQSIWDADVFFLGRTVENPQPNQVVRIIWTANNQQVFSFTPQVYPENGNNILDPIIQVMTEGNFAGFDRYNSISGGMDTPLKIRLVDGSTTKTYENYLPLLQELGLDDNMKSLLTLDDIAFSLIQKYNAFLLQYVFQMVLVAAVFLLVVMHSVPLLFELDARRVAIRKLFGYPFVPRHRRFFIIFASVWALTVFVTVVFRPTFDSPFGNLPQTLGHLLFCAGVFFIIEALVSSIALSFVESRRIGNIIKGEF